MSAANNNEMRLRIRFLSSILPMYRASPIDPIVILVWA
jgi:ABC-type lipoprotein release transport system permease subunit